MQKKSSAQEKYALLNWLNRNRQKLDSYGNQYIAYNTKGVIAHSQDWQEAFELAKCSRQNFAIYFLPQNLDSLSGLPISLREVSTDKWLPSYQVNLKHKNKVTSASMVMGAGADFTVIPHQIGKQLGFDLVKQEQTLLAQGIKGTVEYVFRNLELNIKGHNFTSPVVWLQGDSGEEQILLGKELVAARFNEASSSQAEPPPQKNNKVMPASVVKEESKTPQMTPATKPEEKANKPEKTANYEQKTERIKALSQFIKSVAPFIWAAVILLVIIPLVGRFLIVSSEGVTATQKLTEPNPIVVVKPRPKLDQLNEAVVVAVKDAEVTAEEFASQELDEWQQELIPRVDNFLDWYFGYINQKKIEFSTPFTWLSSSVLHKLNFRELTPQEAVAMKLTKNFQKEFAKRVLLPKNAQIKLEVLTTETVNLYLAELGDNIDKVKSSYKIPQGQWNRYLSDISTTVNDTDGNISNLSLKALVGGGGYLLAKPLIISFAGKVGSKISAKFAGKAASKLAAKTGSAVGAELGASMIDPIVGIGILVWDIWDYNHTVKVERPI
ncbi:MAG: retropepsin-like domain-containing protein, partial [Spirulinaceae cyanobacterium]